MFLIIKLSLFCEDDGILLHVSCVLYYLVLFNFYHSINILLIALLILYNTIFILLIYLPADTKSIVRTHTLCTTHVDKNRHNRTFYNGIGG